MVLVITYQVTDMYETFSTRFQSGIFPLGPKACKVKHAIEVMNHPVVCNNFWVDL